MRHRPSRSTASPDGSTVTAGQPWPRPVIVLAGAASVVIAVAGMKAAADIVGPLCLALILVITVAPLGTWLRRHHVPGWVALTVVFVVTYGILLVLAAALVWSVARLVDLLPQYQSEFTDFVNQLAGWLGGFGITQSQLLSALRSLDPSSIVNTLQTVLSSTVNILSALLLLLALLFFMTIDARRFEQGWEAARSQRPYLVSALFEFAHSVRQYVWVSTVFGLIVAAVDVLVLMWLAIPLPLLWGLLAFITNYIPNIGFVIGLVPPALLGLLEGGWRDALLVVLLYSVINLVIQSLIQPRIVGNAVGLSGTLTFLSLIFWAFVIGPLGALLAVPLSLLAKALLVDADPGTRWVRPLLGSGEPSAD